MIDSLRALLDDIVDYAGLFPPAQLPMEQAVQEYARYLADRHRSMLARFVVPVARLGEFEDAVRRRDDGEQRDAGSKGTGAGVAKPWHLSALVGVDMADDFSRILEFNERHGNGATEHLAVIDVIEIKASSPESISEGMRILPQGMQAFFEIPLDPDPTPLIQAIREAGGKAKIRTGGVTANAFPAPEQVVRFILACRDNQVTFKATAGLHHPIRAEYRLTYEPDPPRGVMYGYLNIFGAALLAQSGAPDALVLQLLQETDINALTFDSAGFTYRGHVVPTSLIRATRESFAISFGSCSFREPVDDLIALGLLS